MKKKSVTAVFDIGKTNKKFFLFDEEYREVFRAYTKFEEVADEEGYPADDLPAICNWLKTCFEECWQSGKYTLKALNFSTYGASLVHLDHKGKAITPLYNYTKPIPEPILDQFYQAYGPASRLALETASPTLAMLNSGLQLYYLKYSKPEVFGQIRYSLHFPQYLSYLFTGIPISEYTSIGCHTALWDFAKNDYHDWVYSEGMDRLFPAIVPTDTRIQVQNKYKNLRIGVGVHDSSAALMPYLSAEKKPFSLISTGTWSICLNPFSEEPLTERELKGDCLNFMRLDGKRVKASRLFLGQEYKNQVDQLCLHFGEEKGAQHGVEFDPAILAEIRQSPQPKFHFDHLSLGRQQTAETDWEIFPSFAYAYHRLMYELVELQIQSLKLALGSTAIKKIYVDGGFAQNTLYMKLMAAHLPDIKLRSTEAALGSALGAAFLVSSKKIPKKFLKTNYGLIKHRP